MSRDRDANLAMWNRLEISDTPFLKRAKLNGREVVTVDPLYNVRRVTEELGPVGFAWGWEVKAERTEDYGEGQDRQTVHTCVVRAWFRQEDGSKEHVEHVGTTPMAYWSVDRYGKKPPRFILDSDAPKKSVTDALKKILVHLGASADIWLGRFDGDKYVPPETPAEAETHDPETGEVGGSAGDDRGQRTYSLNGKRHTADEWIVEADRMARGMDAGKLGGFLASTKGTRNDIYKHEAGARKRLMALSEDIKARALGAAAGEGAPQ